MARTRRSSSASSVLGAAAWNAARQGFHNMKLNDQVKKRRIVCHKHTHRGTHLDHLAERTVAREPPMPVELIAETLRLYRDGGIDRSEVLLAMARWR